MVKLKEYQVETKSILFYQKEMAIKKETLERVSRCMLTPEILRVDSKKCFFSTSLTTYSSNNKK